MQALEFPIHVAQDLVNLAMRVNWNNIFLTVFFCVFVCLMNEYDYGIE